MRKYFAFLLLAALPLPAQQKPAAGATITPTEPQLAAEPLPAGPKPVNPVNPSTPL
jgi:hypothetical protein